MKTKAFNKYIDWFETPSIGHISFFMIFKTYILILLLSLYIVKDEKRVDIMLINLKIITFEIYYVLLCYITRPIYNLIVMIKKKVKK